MAGMSLAIDLSLLHGILLQGAELRSAWRSHMVDGRRRSARRHGRAGRAERAVVGEPCRIGGRAVGEGVCMGAAPGG